MPSKRRHRCLKPGCQVMMPYSKLACPPHWHELPQHLKSAIYANYKPGQTMITASDAYLAAFYAAIDYWHEDADSRAVPLTQTGEAGAL